MEPVVEVSDATTVPQWKDNRLDLTKLPWRLQCVTADVDPVDSIVGNKTVHEDYKRMRDFSTQQGQCSEFGLDVNGGLPLKAGQMPGEVHRQLKSLGVFHHDILYRFEHVN